MNALENSIYDWPLPPPLPAPGQVVLVRVATSQPRPVARLEKRAVLRKILVPWSGLSPAKLSLVEMERGPAWQRLLGGHSLGISISYGKDEAWLGLYRGGRIGIDVMPVESFPEAEEVARLYLRPDALEKIRRAENPARAFAAEWTAHEALLKCLGKKLTEWHGGEAGAIQHRAVQESFSDAHRMVSVATIFGETNDAPRVSP